MPADDRLEKPLSQYFNEALTFAATMHRTQPRKGTQIPYVAHTLAVSSLVLEHGGDEDQAIAGLLHDVVEDQGGAHVAKEIRRRFGDRVGEIVEGCTDANVIPKPPWEERKRAYIARVATESNTIRLASAADKLHNARAILSDYRELKEELWPRFNGGKKGTLWYYRGLLEAASKRRGGRASPKSWGASSPNSNGSRARRDEAKEGGLASEEEGTDPAAAQGDVVATLRGRGERSEEVVLVY